MNDRRIQLSVLIASHNRRQLLRRCLDSLTVQAADPACFEVIVADDGSDDGTAEMVEELPVPFALRVLRLEKSGKSAALNAAIAAAAGPACLFLDDDIVASPELIAGHLGAHTNGRVLGIGAITEQPPAASDWYANAFAQGWAEHNAELATRPARWTDCYGANFSAPLALLREIGGFSVDLAVAEDFDIAFRLWQAGCAPHYLPRAHGIHDDQKRSQRMLTDARRQGEVHVELAAAFPQAEAELLDWGGGADRRELTLRRLCLALRVPPAPLAWIGRFLPGDGRKMIWLHFVRRLSFWRGAKAAASPSQWALLTRRPARRAKHALASPLALMAVDMVEVVPL
jgi:glycosyltransferase involved in cell wall biosynthesis